MAVCQHSFPVKIDVVLKFRLAMKTKLLDYYKMILNKVSFDANLFLKEYRKAIRSLQNHDEIGHLENWLRETGLHAIVAQSQDNHSRAER